MNKLNIKLKQYFGYDEFRSGQEEVISSILNCNDTLAVMPTGGGKSICYQLPALLMEGTVIVVSPLIALMKDQVDSLIGGNIRATSINSALSYPEINDRLLRASKGEYKLLYVAPERLENKYFLSLLSNINIPFIAVDEAHCISEWGHDFRPSYMNIGKMFEFIPRCPLLALTATATREVQDDIVNSLKMNLPKRIVKGFNRKNLSYFTENTYKKTERIADIVTSANSGSTIIYAGSRRRVEQFTTELKEHGVKSEAYHAGMKVLLRNAVQERFITGRTKVIVATNAFGMGIDKDDVRNVIHVDYPLTLEAYYQEAGRAGRDGKPSDCYLLITDGDRDLPDYFIKSTYPDSRDIDKVITEIVSIFDKRTFSADIDNNFLPDPLVLANQIGMDYRTAKSVYGILERTDVIAKGNLRSQAKIAITTSRERISEYFDNSPVSRQYVLDALLRSISPDVFSRSVAFSIKDLIIKHSVAKNDFDELIKSMQLLGLIRYSSDSEGQGYYLNKYVKSAEDIKIDKEQIARRCAYAIKKLDSVIEYSVTDSCKRNFILDYFDDTEYNGTCGKCTYCNSKKIKNEINSSKPNYKILKYQLLNIISDNGGNIETLHLRKQFGDFLKAEEIQIDNKSNGFLSEADIINNEINILYKSRLIEFENKYKSKISITQTGAEFLKQIPEQSKIMARIEKAKTRSEIIFNKLVTLRREIAENAGVVPRGIISDVAMRKIAEVLPETEYDLKNVAGVSQLFVQKFAKIFLQELSKIKLNPKEQKVSKVAKDALKLLEQGESFETIKMRLFAGNITMMANYVVEIVEAGYEIPRKQLVPDTVYSKVKACVKKNPEYGPRDLQTKLTMDIESSTLKMACAFAKLELGL